MAPLVALGIVGAKPALQEVALGGGLEMKDRSERKG
jgi:hypothetical protein